MEVATDEKFMSKLQLVFFLWFFKFKVSAVGPRLSIVIGSTKTIANWNYR
jgi:hypothetical protein